MRSTIYVALLTLIMATAASAQQAPASSHERAASELIELLKLEEQTSLALDLMGGMPADNPMAEVLREVTRGFIEEFLPWSKLQPEYVRIYTGAFTETELRELIAFYRTPLGLKLIDSGPAIGRQTMETTQRLMAPHMGELQRRIMQRMGGG